MMSLPKFEYYQKTRILFKKQKRSFGTMLLFK